MNKSLNTNSKNYWPEIAVDEEDIKIADNITKKYRLKKFISIVPDASLPDKQWPIQNWDEIIRYLKDSYKNYGILILGINKKKIDFLIKRNPHIINPAQLLPLRVIYLIFKRSSLVITQDGGPMHLAWAGKSSLITLISGYKYRSKKLNKFNYIRPLNKNSMVLYNNMDKIKIEEVKSAIDKMLLDKR